MTWGPASLLTRVLSLGFRNADLTPHGEAGWLRAKATPFYEKESHLSTETAHGGRGNAFYLVGAPGVQRPVVLVV